MDYQGLSDQEVAESKLAFGANETENRTKSTIWLALLNVILEPLFIILVFAAIIYFLLGESTEGIIMLVALGLVSGISLFQENKSRSAVNALKLLSSPQAKVFRNGEVVSLPTEEIVMNDLILVEDGNLIPADGKIVEAHDFSVNESILTGESLAVFKDTTSERPLIYQGTMVDTGSCVAEVCAIGGNTALGKVGASIGKVVQTKTPLQIQIKRFVRSMVIVGAIAFLMVWVINYLISRDLLNALLQGLTLAMSVLPEEIPVAFSTFMALGAYHLYKKKIISRSPYTVETLGAATVICTDKTGTLTENKMELRAIFEHRTGRTVDLTKSSPVFSPVLEYGLWASEILPFDPMEKSIHHFYAMLAAVDERAGAKMIHEYPLAGTPPIMTHVFKKQNGQTVIAVKGSVEGVLNQTKLNSEEKALLFKKVNEFSSQGYRILGVGKASAVHEKLPESQSELTYEFLGLLAFYDPPKANISTVLNAFYEAGIDVKVITGDYAKTAVAIANQVGLKTKGHVVTGDSVMALSQEELVREVKDVSIFARMFPEAKLRVVEALKANGEIVAMTGDGVNDAPALKSAHIGIAMGQRGSEVAKMAADLVLMDDDLSHMPEAIALGRRIYENLKKAIRYIISIHIPIILIVLLPLVLGWDLINLFSPIHVIFLELIMGPTCSIVFENEPLEANSMQQPPRKMSDSFFSFKELSLSVVQGIAITVVCLSLGYVLMQQGESDETVRTVVFTTLVFCNLFLTLANRSFYYSVLQTIRYPNKLMPLILGASLVVLVIALLVAPVRAVFEFETIPFELIVYALLAAFAGVFWLEILKYWRRRTSQDTTAH
nr:HAD-IC family P-type ATPase [Cytophagales bacterium]